MKKFISLSLITAGFLYASSNSYTLKKIIPDESTVIVNQDYIDNLPKGWNLIGVEHNISNLFYKT